MLGTEPQIIESFIRNGDVKFVYRHLAQLGDDSVLAGEASECAAGQGKFWEMRQELYARQGELYSDVRGTSMKIASDLGIDAQALGSCMDKGTHRQAVLNDYQAAQQEGVRSRPEFRIGDKRIVGSLPFEQFKNDLDAALGR